MDARYCQECGRELVPREIGDEGAVPYCMSCKKPYFGHPVTSVLVAVVNDRNQVVLLRQNYVSKSNWVLVAGYIKVGETIEQAVSREVVEETGLDISECSYVGSYFHGGKSILMIGFVAFSKSLDLKHHSKEVDDLKWEDMASAVSRLRDGSIGQIHLTNVINRLVGKDALFEHDVIPK